MADTLPNDPFFELMWGLNNTSPESGQPGADVGAVRAWDIATGSESVVAVLDTGVDLSHPDLAKNVWVNAKEIPDNRLDDDRNGFVDDTNGWDFLNNDGSVFDHPDIDNHGTHVAGTIGAVGNNGIGITGVAWRVTLMPLKFLDGDKNEGFIANAVKAINYVIGQKRRGVDLVAINASWISPGKSRALREAIQAAGNAGILFICAAGNDGLDTDEGACLPGCA